MQRTTSIMMTLLLAGWSVAHGKQQTTAAGVPVTICYGYGPGVSVDGPTLTVAQHVTSQLLADAGVRLEWRFGKPGCERIKGQTIGMIFIGHAPMDFSTRDRLHALAAAWPYADGVAISIFQDRVTNYVNTMPQIVRQKVLGYVLAHEIVHVLEGEARHSVTGLMKAHWSGSDLCEIEAGRLGLAEEDLVLIRLRFAAAAAPSPLP